MKIFTRLNFNFFMIKKLLPVVLLAFVMNSCDKKFNDVGAEILPLSTIQGNKTTYPVKISHQRIDVVQTNNIPVLQLGQRNDNLFGTTTAAIVAQMNLSSAPTFGEKSAQLEIDSPFNEMETVTDVWLEIPFFTNQKDSDGDGLIDEFDIDDEDPNSDSDGDGVSDIQERNDGTDPTNPDTDGDGTPDGLDDVTTNPNPSKKLYSIDSLFGNRQATFDVEVTKLNYFLRQLDPNQNFEQSQVYNSNFPIQSYKEQQLGSENVQLNFSEIVVEGDENTNITPRLRVALDKTFFQQFLLDKEGDDELSSPEAWQDYFRSIAIETSNFSAPLLMLLDVNKMIIRVAYSYKVAIADTSPVEIEDKEKEFFITASSIKFNTLTQTAPADATLDAIVSATNVAQIALGGGLGTVATINLFEDNEVLEDIKGKPWILNEANLTFYVDKNEVQQFGLSLPERLYLYKANSGVPVIDYTQDVAPSTLPKLVYGGFLVEEDEKQYYKIRITDHLRNIIANDSINAPLRLSLTNAFESQNALNMVNVENSALKKVPAGAVSTPKSAVFIGPNPSDPAQADFKLQLELYYTEIE